MRKYYTLVLITVTLVSLVCLVFYKTQYDKLYNVLQVLEFFGSEPNSAKSPLWEKALLPGVETFRPPSFQRINDNVFVYSAFCFSTPGVKEEGHCGTVMAVAVVRAPIDTSKFACKLWYEGSFSGLAGSFSTAETTAESSAAAEGFKSYQLFCQNKFASKAPFSVEFISEAKGERSLRGFVLKRDLRWSMLTFQSTPPFTCSSRRAASPKLPHLKLWACALPLNPAWKTPRTALSSPSC